MKTMAAALAIDFFWVPTSVGGHRSEPYSGMRLTIRWQRYLEAYLQRSRDVECISLTFDSKQGRGAGIFSLLSDDALPSEWLREGELIELLSGYKVLAVGKILHSDYQVAR